jgi:hypothetical protein
MIHNNLNIAPAPSFNTPLRHVKTVEIEEKEFLLSVDRIGKPVVTVGKKSFRDFRQLLADYPCLKEEKNLNGMATMLLFFIKPQEGEIIGHPEFSDFEKNHFCFRVKNKAKTMYQVECSLATMNLIFS